MPFTRDNTYVVASTSRWQRFLYKPVSSDVEYMHMCAVVAVFIGLGVALGLIFPGIRGSNLGLLLLFLVCVIVVPITGLLQDKRRSLRGKAHEDGRLILSTDDVYKLVMSSSVRSALEAGDKDVARVVDNFFIGVRPGWFDTVTASTDMLARGYSAVDNPLLYSISREVDDAEFLLHVRGVFESRYSELLEQARADRADASDALIKSDSAVRTYASLLGQSAYPA